MQPRFSSRAALVAVVVIGLVAGAIGAAWLLRQPPLEPAQSEAPAAEPARAPAAEPRRAAAPAAADNKLAAPPPPARERVGTSKDGAKRASCGAACAIEARCALRARAVCERESCEGPVRKVNRSDFALDNSQSCADVAVLPCEEACWKRGECAGHHETDAVCTRTCTTLARQRPAAVYVESRCILENACADIPVCGAL